VGGEVRARKCKVRSGEKRLERRERGIVNGREGKRK